MNRFFMLIRGRARELILGSVLAGFCLLICFLYHLPRAAMGYLLLLWGVYVLAVLAAAVWDQRRRHRALSRLMAAPALAAEGLPPARDAAEADYQALVRALASAMEDQQADARRARQDMIDYYTLWAHQIKTPIAALDLLLQRQEETPETRTMAVELLYIRQYVEMVLSYLRLGSDFSDLVLTRQDLDAIVRPAVRKFAPLFIEKKLTLDYAPLGQTVLTDGKWLGFVVEQLLSNAVKYTPSGGTVRIFCPGPETLVIADSGIGIRREDLPRVFDRGFTGHNGRVQQGSTGIGLSLCRQVCGMLGHGIAVDSAPGAGTRVTLSLAERPLQGD